MAINLSKVNISLDEFQRLSRGEFNAGEVKLAGENKLAKMNNHVHQLGKNKETISHVEVIAIKEALVRALSQNGVGRDEINRIRRELGLAPDGTADRTLAQRSVKPLTRQQIREILDRNAATFRASIPGVERSDEKTAEEPGQKATVDPKRLLKRVLVVDDSPVNRSILMDLLGCVGVTSVEQAVDGEEALAELVSALKAGNPYDLVFSDYWMPNLNGLELMEKLRADSRFKDLPVFALTADTEAKQDARAKLFTGILIKPITYNNLVAVLSATRRTETS